MHFESESGQIPSTSEVEVMNFLKLILVAVKFILRSSILSFSLFLPCHFDKHISLPGTIFQR